MHLTSHQCCLIRDNEENQSRGPIQLENETNKARCNAEMKPCEEINSPAQIRTRRECLVWARKLNGIFHNRKVNKRENGTQANNFACTCVKQQQLLAEGHVRSHLDWSRTRRTVTCHFNPSTQSWHSLRKFASNMRHQQQTIQQIYSCTGQ